MIDGLITSFNGGGGGADAGANGWRWWRPSSKATCALVTSVPGLFMMEAADGEFKFAAALEALNLSSCYIGRDVLA